MADEQSPPAPNADLPISVLAQYVKDVSFENPNAPESLKPMETAPEMEVNIGMDARKLEDPNIDNFYEVVLSINARASHSGNPIFIAEIQYAAAVTIHPSVPEGGHHPILLIEIPRLIFPYARQYISNLTIHGGYPPLLLNPVDFQALYMDRFGAEIEAAQSKQG